MSERDRFLALLARAASDPGIKLSEQDAAGLLRRYDAGEIDAHDLPLAPDEQVNRDDLLGKTAAALLLLLLLRRRTPARLSRVMLERARDRASDRFETVARHAADLYANTKMTLAEWQRSLDDMVRGQLAAQAMLGAGTADLGGAALARLRADIQTQAAFVSRFADDVAIRALRGRPMSAAEMGARAALYAGAAYGLYFYAHEATEGAGREGYVSKYTARDDRHTCTRCHAAEGYYLPTDGPYPGSVCLGRSRCRCVRTLEYNPTEYRRLMGAA